MPSDVGLAAASLLHLPGGGHFVVYPALAATSDDAWPHVHADGFAALATTFLAYGVRAIVKTCG